MIAFRVWALRKKKSGEKKDARGGERDRSIWLYQALLHNDRMRSRSSDLQVESFCTTTILSCGIPAMCSTRWCHVDAEVPQACLWGSPVLVTSFLFWCNRYSLPFARRKVNAIPWLQWCHFFSANEPLPNVSEKNIYCVQIFLCSLQADWSPVGQGEGARKGKNLFLPFQN